VCVCVYVNAPPPPPPKYSVKEDRILFLTLIVAPTAVHALAYSFPKVHIVTTAVDERVDENYHVIPGIGVFGV